MSDITPMTVHATADEVVNLRESNLRLQAEVERLREENDALRMKLDYAVAKLERYREGADRG